MWEVPVSLRWQGRGARLRKHGRFAELQRCTGTRGDQRERDAPFPRLECERPRDGSRRWWHAPREENVGRRAVEEGESHAFRGGEPQARDVAAVKGDGDLARRDLQPFLLERSVTKPSARRATARDPSCVQSAGMPPVSPLSVGARMTPLRSLRPGSRSRGAPATPRATRPASTVAVTIRSGVISSAVPRATVRPGRPGASPRR